jgi:hypothetical protein
MVVFYSCFTHIQVVNFHFNTFDKSIPPFQYAQFIFVTMKTYQVVICCQPYPPSLLQLITVFVVCCMLHTLTSALACTYCDFYLKIFQLPS